MSRLIVHLFGAVRIAFDGDASAVRTTRAVQGLIAYLMLERRCLHSRESLAERFWPDLPAERSRSCLSTTLWRTRRILEPEPVPRGTFITCTPSGDVGFNAASDFWLDVAVLEAEAGRALARPEGSWGDGEVHSLATSLALHSADLLEGFYDEWAIAERERLRALYCEAQLRVMRHHASHGAVQKSLACAHEILRIDALREDVHRELMAYYLRNGQRALAARQYRSCCDVLRTRLDVAPSPETAAMYAAVAADGPASSTVEELPAVHDPGTQAALRRALTKMDELAAALADARSELEQTLAARPRTPPS